jgi:predicted acyltransferase
MDSGEFSLSQPLVAEPARAKTRIVALDVYRGLVMFGMIIADCQVDGYSFVSHAHWDGLTGIDLIFPSFLFIMGLSIPLSIRGSFGYRPLVRTLEMLAIGLFLNLQVDNFHFQEWRFPGVLQRIALCYLVVAVLHWLSDYGKHLYVQISAAIVLSVCYISFMVGESHSQGCSHLTPECNFGRDIDSAIFGDKHLMQPTDPEGILSTCTSVVTSLGGYFVSLIMQKHKENKSRMLT